MIAADNNGRCNSGHDITLYIGTGGTVEWFEGIIFSRTPKMLTGLVKKSF
jgi:hypothetical protein